jgi:hypothetical protein
MKLNLKLKLIALSLACLAFSAARYVRRIVASPACEGRTCRGLADWSNIRNRLEELILQGVNSLVNIT